MPVHDALVCRPTSWASDGLSDRVEVFFHDEGELYVAPTGGGEALVSALFNHSQFRRDGVPYLLSRTPRLRDRIARLEFTTQTLASPRSGFWFHVLLT